MVARAHLQGTESTIGSGAQIEESRAVERVGVGAHHLGERGVGKLAQVTTD